MEWQFGAVIFDKPEAPASGYASIAGEPAERITDQTQLANDVLWWSNATYDAFFRGGQAMVGNLRSASYLDVKVAETLKDWGIDPSRVPPDQSARVCSALFERIMRMARGLIKTSSLNLREEDFFQGNKLAHDLKDLLPQAECPVDDTASVLRAGISFTHFSTTTIQRPSGSSPVIVRRPRLDHAIDIVSSPVPNGPFSFRRGADLPSPEKIAAAAVPVMAEVTLHRADPSISAIYGFGVTPTRARKSTRSWIAHPELAIMSGFADLELRGGLIGRSYSVLSETLDPMIHDFLVKPGTCMSWSAGALAETIWKAATTGRGMPGMQVSNAARPQTSWRGAWLKATDKVVMLRFAMQLHRAGFAVLSYGSGWVNCAVPASRMEEYVLAAWRFGMVPSLFEVPRVFSEAELNQYPWGGDEGSKFWATMVLGKKSQALWELDRLSLAAPDEQGEIVARVVEMIRTDQQVAG